MVNIIKATEDHVDYISDSLSNYFSKANLSFGYPRYKEDSDLILKHVSKRIGDENSNFFYFIAVDESNNPIGFINLLLNGDNVGSILVVISDQEEISKELVNRAMDFFKEKNILIKIAGASLLIIGILLIVL